jgi:lipid II:glycine glycyltransferase (peptidoglycan interpeptide bridge formation enzyme)
MANVTVKAIEHEEEWEEFLTHHPEANFLQSWYWGEFHQNYGNAIHRAGFYKNNKLIGLMLSVVENAKRGRYLTIPAGPIIDWQDADLVNQFAMEIKRVAKEQNCVFVRVRPQLESNEFSQDLFKKLGFIEAPIHLHAELTSQLDITKSEEELLAQMRKTTRYEIRKATSLGITIKTTDDPTAIKKFYDLEIITSKRQGFVPFSYSFLFEQFKAFAQAKKVLLYTAEFEGKLLAQAFIIFYGVEAAYHYGASTEDGRKYPGAYLIQWEVIKDAKKRGMTRYNFWGVAPEDQKDHRFYGLSVFKRGFGGVDFEYLHARDLVINRSRYLINATIEKTRKYIRRV